MAVRGRGDRDRFVRVDDRLAAQRGTAVAPPVRWRGAVARDGLGRVEPGRDGRPGARGERPPRRSRRRRRPERRLHTGATTYGRIGHPAGRPPRGGGTGGGRAPAGAGGGPRPW